MLLLFSEAPGVLGVPQGWKGGRGRAQEDHRELSAISLRKVRQEISGKYRGFESICGAGSILEGVI